MGNRTRCSYLLKGNPSGPRDCSRAMARQPLGKSRRNWATHSWMASGVCSNSPCSTLLEPSTCRAQACFLSPQSIPMKAATSAGKRLLYRTYLSFMAYGLPVYGQGQHFLIKEGAGGMGIGYAGLFLLNIDLCVTITGPTNGRLDSASGWDGFGFPFHWKVFVFLCRSSLWGRRGGQA